MRFWDSSAVVPLIVGQPISGEADRWLSEDPALAIWTLTPIELTSAIQRLVREGVLGEREAAHAESRADELVRASHIVINVEGVKAQARRLLRLHALRAADALQLGSAIEWTSGRTAGRRLHTLDAQLGRAAAREGFDVVPRPT
ncbi:MAG: type II toxin-antitoxin system VapC family toxin [Pseudomonadota bacterium]